MKRPLSPAGSKFLTIATALGLTLAAAPPANAQRGVEFMNSPGYQRALIESRKRRLEAGQAASPTKPAENPARVRKRQQHRR